jgi:hypothetical protein
VTEAGLTGRSLRTINLLRVVRRGRRGFHRTHFLSNHLVLIVHILGVDERRPSCGGISRFRLS